MTAEHRASLAWLAAQALALEGHFQQIRDDRAWAHEQLRGALQAAGVKSFSDETIGVTVSVTRSRRRFLRPIAPGRYRLIPGPDYVAVKGPK